MLKHYRLVCFAVLCVLLVAAAAQVKAQMLVSYDEFLVIRKNPDVIILNAAQLEKYFMVVPENMAAEGKGISQSQLDTLLASLIPTKETEVVLFCYENFQPTRRLSANNVVSYSLKENGYKNIKQLKNLYNSTDPAEIEKALRLGEKEIIPYTKKIPENYPLDSKSE